MVRTRIQPRSSTRHFEIIRAQLDLEDWMLEHRESIAAHIERGFTQAERGELIDGDAAIELYDDGPNA